MNMFYLVLVVITGTAYLSAFLLGYLLESIDEAVIIGNLMFTVLLSIVSIRSVFIQYKIMKATGGEFYAKLQFTGLVLITLWAIIALSISFYNLFVFFQNYPSPPAIILNLIDVAYYVGLLLFIIVIILNPDYIYRLPLNIQDIVIFSVNGYAVYGIGKNASQKSLDEQLLAGFITATNNFMNEMTPKYDNESIKFLQSSNRIIRLEFGTVLGICIVSNRENWYLYRSITELIAFIEAQNPKQLVEAGTFFEDTIVRDWLKATFPYLEVDALQTY